MNRSSLIEILPDELIELIAKELDIISVFRFAATCKAANLLSDPKVILCKSKTIPFTDHETGTIHKIENLNQMCSMIQSWLAKHVWSTGVIYMPKKIYHTKMLQNIDLRFTKNEKGRCTFIVTDIALKTPQYSNIQVIYEPEYQRYRMCGLNNTSSNLTVPLLLLYIGFRVLFETHGYQFVPCFDKINIHHLIGHTIPDWFRRIICCPTYDGMFINDILTGVAEFY